MLNKGKRLFEAFHFEVNRKKNLGSFEKSFRNIENNPLFKRSTFFSETITENFKRYLALKQSF